MSENVTIDLDIAPAMKPFTVIARGVTYTGNFLSANEALTFQKRFAGIPDDNMEGKLELTFEMIRSLGLPEDVFRTLPSSALVIFVQRFLQAQSSTSA